MDYRNFLQADDEHLSLPYFGTGEVCNGHRSWRVRDNSLRPGWYQFRILGRNVEVIDSIDAQLYDWQSKGITGPLRGYQTDGRFIGDNHQAKLFDLPHDEDLERFAPITAWQWFDGHLMLDGVDFESEVEQAVRNAYDDETPIDSIKGVTPALVNAFILESTKRELVREQQRRQEQEARLKQVADQQVTLDGRIATALSHSGAELIDWRRQGKGQITVRYRVGRQRIECVIDPNSLNIIDSGICLSGADRELNLSSLPSAVQEAIDTGQLHVYRRG